MMLPDRIFDDMFDFGEPRMHPPKERMDCDIYEKDGKYFVEASVFGFNKDEIKIEAEDGSIVISAEKKEDSKAAPVDEDYEKRREERRKEREEKLRKMEEEFAAEQEKLRKRKEERERARAERMRALEEEERKLKEAREKRRAANEGN